jgi:hypothetical protein
MYKEGAMKRDLGVAIFACVFALGAVAFSTGSSQAQEGGPLVVIPGPLQPPFLNPTTDKLDQILRLLQPVWSRKLQCDSAACPRFELVLDDYAVLDRETGLVWEQSPSTNTIDWFNARVHCIQRTVGNRKGWRLPTVEELASLVDPSVPVPSPLGSTLPPGHPFNLPNPSNVQSSTYWSATTFANQSTFAWAVFFGSGDVTTGEKSFGTFHFVWCVRGGQGGDNK